VSAISLLDFKVPSDKLVAVAWGQRIQYSPIASQYRMGCHSV